MLGGKVTLTAVVSGGTQPYSFVYTGLPAGCSTADSASLTCTPTAAGTFHVSVSVRDANSLQTGGTATLEVNAAVTAPTISSFAASPSTMQIGGTTYLNVTATGGAAPYAYRYTGLPAGCASSDSAILTCVPTASGTFTIRVFVNDSAGRGANTTTSLVVNGGGTTSGTGIPFLWIALIAVIAVAAVAAVLLLMRRKKAPPRLTPYGNNPPPPPIDTPIPDPAAAPPASGIPVIRRRNGTQTVEALRPARVRP